MNKINITRALGMLGAAFAAAALFLDGKATEAGGVLAAAFSSPSLWNKAP